MRYAFFISLFIGVISFVFTGCTHKKELGEYVYLENDNPNPDHVKVHCDFKCKKIKNGVTSEFLSHMKSCKYELTFCNECFDESRIQEYSDRAYYNLRDFYDWTYHSFMKPTRRLYEDIERKYGDIIDYSTFDNMLEHIDKMELYRKLKEDNFPVSDNYEDFVSVMFPKDGIYYPYDFEEFRDSIIDSDNFRIKIYKKLTKDKFGLPKNYEYFEDALLQ